MIHADFRLKDQAIVSFEITGHADYAAHGSDIVCAAVSALALTTINSIEALAGYQPIVSIDQDQGGYLYCEILSDLSPESSKISQTLLQSLLIGLEGIQTSYGSYLKLSTN